MTNAQIIAKAMKDNGITEPAHTFAAWKSLGFHVNKGEKATFKARIWKFVSKKNDEGESEGKMFLKTAHFFTASQVSKIS